jgi:hypothetical protein
MKVVQTVNTEQSKYWGQRKRYRYHWLLDKLVGQ